MADLGFWKRGVPEVFKKVKSKKKKKKKKKKKQNISVRSASGNMLALCKILQFPISKIPVADKFTINVMENTVNN